MNSRYIPNIVQCVRAFRVRAMCNISVCALDFVRLEAEQSAPKRIYVLLTVTNVSHEVAFCICLQTRAHLLELMRPLTQKKTSVYFL